MKSSTQDKQQYTIEAKNMFGRDCLFPMTSKEYSFDKIVETLQKFSDDKEITNAGLLLERILYNSLKDSDKDFKDKSANEISHDKYRKKMVEILDGKSSTYGIYLSKNKSFDRNAIERLLREDVYKGRTTLSRQKIFAICLALDLNYNQAQELLLKSAFECNFNYKDPYEVMLVWSLIDTNNGGDCYIRYSKLVKEYEKRCNTAIEKDYSSSTLQFKDRLSEIKNSNELMDYILTLPNTNSKSAYNTFMEYYNKIDADNEYLYKDSFDSYELKQLKGKRQNSVTFMLRTVFKKVKGLGGQDLFRSKDVKFSFLNDCLPTVSGYKKIIKIGDTATVTRNDILNIAFYNYVNSETYYDHLYTIATGGKPKEYEDRLNGPINDVLASSKKIVKLFHDYEDYMNEALNKASFLNIYLANPYDCFLFLCLLTNSPFSALNAMIKERDCDEE